MDAVVPKSEKGPIKPDEHSHLVRPAGMEWQKTRFPGCEIKTLMFDPNTGLMTSLEVVEANPILDVRNASAAFAVELVQSAFGKRIL